MAWLALLAAGFFEVAFTTCIRFAEGFRHPGWTAGFLVSAALSFLLLERAARSIPLGTAYAVWVGIGAAGTALVGIAFFGEQAGGLRLLLLFLLVATIIGLKLITPA